MESCRTSLESHLPKMRSIIDFKISFPITSTLMWSILLTNTKYHRYASVLLPPGLIDVHKRGFSDLWSMYYLIVWAAPSAVGIFAMRAVQ